MVAIEHKPRATVSWISKQSNQRRSCPLPVETQPVELVIGLHEREQNFRVGLARSPKLRIVAHGFIVEQRTPRRPASAASLRCCPRPSSELVPNGICSTQ